MKRKVTILGAGIQGCCTALELANRGFKVQILDQDSVPFNRTSVRNEGKIHLGLVYMNDPDFSTPTLMLKAALRFTSYLSRWIGENVRDLNLSTPFYYLVANDSFLTPDQLEERYAKLENVYHCLKSEHSHLNYLGKNPEWLAKKSSEEELSKHFCLNELQGGFQTPELAIDAFKLAGHIKKAVDKHPNITFLGNHKIDALSKNGSDYVIKGTRGGDPWKMKSLQVVNATWDNKYKLDQTVGIEVPKNILHRLKYRLIAKIPEEMENYPSVTMVIGRFGDVVIRPDHTAYLSWYPDACRGWTNELEPPPFWEEVCTGNVPEKEFDMISERFISEIQKWYPDVKKCKPKIVDAGTIVALGKTDVDDEESQLHDRSNVGVTSYDGYHTVETGKLTTAPMFAFETANNVEEFSNLL